MLESWVEGLYLSGPYLSALSAAPVKGPVRAGEVRVVPLVEFSLRDRSGWVFTQGVLTLGAEKRKAGFMNKKVYIRRPTCYAPVL